MPWPRPNGHRPSRCRWERHEPKCARSSLARARAASSTHSGNAIPAIEAPTFSGGPARAGAMLSGSIWLNDFRQRDHRNGLVLELSDALRETVSNSGSPRNRTGHPPNNRRRRAAAGIPTHCIAARQRRRAPLSAGSRCARHTHRHHREQDLPCAQSDSDSVRRIRRITNGDGTTHRRAALTPTRDVARLPMRTGRDTIARAGDRMGINDRHRVFSVGSRARFRARGRTPTACTGARHGRSNSPAANIEDVIAVQNAARL